MMFSLKCTSGEVFRDTAAISLSLYKQADPEQMTDRDIFLRAEKQGHCLSCGATSARLSALEDEHRLDYPKRKLEFRDMAAGWRRKVEDLEAGLTEREKRVDEKMDQVKRDMSKEIKGLRTNIMKDMKLEIGKLRSSLVGNVDVTNSRRRRRSVRNLQRISQPFRVIRTDKQRS